MKIRRFNEGMFTDGEGENVFQGFAAVYDSPSKLSDDGKVELWETVRRGAFDRFLATSPHVVALVNHNTDLVLASTLNGSLRLDPFNERGLLSVFSPPNTSLGSDTRELVKSGTMKHMSFGAHVALKGGMSRKIVEDSETGKVLVRQTLLDLEVFDVSIVPFPAYLQTSVEVRSGEETEELMKSVKEELERQAKNRMRKKVCIGLSLLKAV
jgi:uncharacterized protein